jgi:hypothetical protein
MPLAKRFRAPLSNEAEVEENQKYANLEPGHSRPRRAKFRINHRPAARIRIAENHSGQVVTPRPVQRAR